MRGKDTGKSGFRRLWATSFNGGCNQLLATDLYGRAMLDRMLHNFQKWRETILFCGHIAILAALPCCAIIAYAIDRHGYEATRIIDTITTSSVATKQTILSTISNWQLRETP